MTAAPPKITIAGADLSLSSTGVALPDGRLCTIQSKHRGIERILDIRNQLIGELSLNGPVQLVAIEGYSFASRNSQAHALGELGGVIRAALYLLQIPYVEISPATLKKYACGKGNASKDQVLVAFVSRFRMEPANSDEADAAWLRAMALDHYGHPVATMPKAHRDALTKIPWPTLEHADA